MKVGIESAQLLYKFDIPFARQSRMEPSHHVHLGDPLPHRLSRSGFDLGDRHFKGMGIPFTRAESAELARENTDIRVIDISIQNIGRSVAVFAPANNARDLAQ